MIGSRPIRLLSGTFLLAALMSSAALAQSVSFPGDFERPDVRALIAMNLGDASVQRLAVPQAQGEAFSVRVWIDGAERTVVLHPHSILTSDYRLMVQNASGAYVAVEAPRPQTFRGAVEGYPESKVAASVFEGRLTAVIRLVHDAPLWGIQPLAEIQDGAAPDLYVVYTDRDALPTQFRCGGAIPVDPTGAMGLGGQAKSTANVMKIAEIACDSDVEFYQKNGSSVTATQNDITTIINNVDAIYQNDVTVQYQINVIYVETQEPDPYSSTNPSTLLNQFQSHWNQQHGADARDVAHLFTGKNLNGSVIGIAYLNVICNLSSAYGLVQSRYTSNMTRRTALSAHELGHNWSASHCDGQSDCRIMCSALGGCTGVVTSFGSSAITKITNKKNNSGCLDVAPPPVAPTISFLTPAAVEAFQSGQVTVTGQDFTGASQVDVGSTTLTLPFGFTIVDDATIVFSAPKPSVLGAAPVTVTNLTGTSNVVNLTYVETDPVEHFVAGLGFAGFPLAASWAGRAGDAYIFGIALSPTTGTFQGATILLSLIPFSSGTLDAIGYGPSGYSIPMPPGASGLTIYPQVWAVDLAAGLSSFQASTFTTTSIL